MAKHLLSARQVQTASVGELRDGAGLILRVKAKSASWIFRFTAPSGRRRELGLGSADRANLEAAGASLKRARKKADEARDLLDRTPPVDPIDVKAAERQAARKAEAERKAAAKRERATLCRAARAYHESAIEPSRTYVHSNNSRRRNRIMMNAANAGIHISNRPFCAFAFADRGKRTGLVSSRLQRTRT